MNSKDKKNWLHENGYGIEYDCDPMSGAMKVVWHGHGFNTVETGYNRECHVWDEVFDKVKERLYNLCNDGY